jgi:hypothetical protein
LHTIRAAAAAAVAFVTLRNAALLVALLACMPAANAVVGGIVDSNESQSPFAGVGSLTRDGTQVYSAVLIAPQYALTAAHVVGRSIFPGTLTFNLNAGGDRPTFSVPVVEIHVHPDFHGSRRAPDGTLHNDIAVLRLAHPVPPGTPIYRLHEGPLDPGQRVLFVGYGAGGEMTSPERVPPQPSLKRKGESEIEWILPGEAAQAVYVFRSRPMVGAAGKGAGLAPGDSGSPSFTPAPDGTLDLLGINTFTINLSPSQPGSFIAGGGGIVLGPHAQWISAVMAQPPGQRVSHALLLGGLALLAVGAMLGLLQWRRRAAGRRR